MQIAMFYADWEKFGEPWNSCRGVRWEFESRGHDVRLYNLYHANGQLLPRKKVRSYSGDCFNRFADDYRRGYRPDAVLVMDYGPFDYVGMDRQYFPDVPFILEAGDTPQSFNVHMRKATKFHAVVTPDAESVTKFHENDVDALWMPHWGDHRIFHPNYDVKPQFDIVSTCGGRRHTAAIKKELGDRFNNERYFFGEDHARRLLMGHIVFQCSQFGEITRRVFEGMACGRMVLTDRLRAETRLDELFEDGKDLVYYDDATDAVNKVNYYMAHPDERENIAARGHTKVMSTHTVSHRADMFEKLIGMIKDDIE